MWASVGVAVAEEEVVVTTELEELDDCEVLVDETELEVLLGAVVPSAEHTVPRPDTSLNVSAEEPLTAPYFDSVADETA